MSQDTLQFKHSIGLLIWMIISQLIVATSIIEWFSLVTDPVMIFAGYLGVGRFLLLIFYPIYPIVMIIGAWISYIRQKNWLAAVLSGLSIAPNVIFYINLIVVN